MGSELGRKYPIDHVMNVPVGKQSATQSKRKCVITKYMSCDCDDPNYFILAPFLLIFDSLFIGENIRPIS